MKKVLALSAELLKFPVLTIVCTVVASYLFPSNVWMVVAITAVMAVVQFLLLKNFLSYEIEDDSRLLLQHLIAMSTSLAIIILLVSPKNYNPNYFGPIHLTVAIGLAAISLLHMFGEKMYWVKWKNEIKTINYNYSWFSQLVFLWLSIFSISEIYIHFGTQFVWFPAIALTAFAWAAFNDEDVRRMASSNESAAYGMTFLPPFVAAISTGWQFWYTVIVFGYALWQVAMCIALLVIIVAIIGGVYDYVKTRKDEKRQAVANAEKRKLQEEKDAIDKTEADRAKSEKEDQKEANRKAVAIKVDLIMKSEQLTWEDVLYVYQHRNAFTMQSLYFKIAELPLGSLVVISRKKKQITWDDTDLSQRLQLVNTIVDHSYNDKMLAQFEIQYNNFLEFTESLQAFTGYERLVSSIKNYAPACSKLFAKEESEL